MSEGKGDLIKFEGPVLDPKGKDQEITPKIKGIINKVTTEVKQGKDDRARGGITDIDEERFKRSLQDAIDNPDAE